MNKFSAATDQLLRNLTPFPWQSRQWAQLIQQKQSGQLAHAYLIQGDQGLGKRLFVEKFAVALLCLNKTTSAACGECSVCKMAVSGSLPDLLVIEPEEGSRDIKIDQVRLLSKFVTKSSHAGSGKIVILDRAHSLNNSAANALLKTLEEPTADTFIFLLTDLPGALSATIRSRCQRLQFAIPSLEAATQWLLEQLPEDSDRGNLSVTFANSPLSAFAEGNSSSAADQAAIISTLTELLSSPSQLRPAVAQSSKIGEQPSIGYLIQVSTILIKGILADAINQKISPELEKLILMLLATGIERRDLSVRLLNYQQKLVQARQQLMSGSNPNPQLIMESLMWQWTKLLT